MRLLLLFLAFVTLGHGWPVSSLLAADPAGPGLPSLIRLLRQVEDPVIQADVLRGMQAALLGRRQVPMPEGWPAVHEKLAHSSSAEVRDTALFLAVLFGDPNALTALRRVALDAAAPADARRAALQALVHKKHPDLVPILHAALADRAVRGTALRGLAVFGHEATPGEILRHYASFTEEEKADAIQTLASRVSFALALLDALDRGQVARRDLSAFTVRQMLGLKDARVAEKLNRVWGVIRPASQEKAALLSRYKPLLTQEHLKKADLARGRLVFVRTCAACHMLFGEGGKIGPELTGSQRTNLDYVLENILDPSAVVARDYQVTIFQTRDGRVITGMVKQEGDKVIAIQTQNELLFLPRAEIEERSASPLSMMPEGLLAKMADEEVRDLVAYLASPAQVALPAIGK